MKRIITTALVGLGWLASIAGVQAEVRLPAIFGNHMVLQQKANCPVWGKASPDEKVKVSLQIDSDVFVKEATANTNGDWRINLDPIPAGKKGTLTIEGKNKITLEDVLFGEVWICSGQSNMEWSVNASADPEKTRAESANPEIRLFTVEKSRSPKPKSELKGRWEICGPNTVGNFSAVAYFFGRDLQKALKKPVGLIHTSWGGTASEEWTSREVLDAHPEHKGKHPAETTLYNAMIAPLIPYAIKGAIWYQGESNAGRSELYRTAFPLMIKNWRDDWKQGDFPFFFVQLAPFMKKATQPTDTGWARLRDAQLETMKKVPATGMAVIVDVGDEADIHPKKKEPVGGRLALAARAIAYGENLIWSGPIYDKMEVRDGRAILDFKLVGQGLEARDGPLTGFTICGSDGKFFNARAEIKGDKIAVWSDDVKEPVAVRYGWADFPLGNLWNKDGLPASPFRTDDAPLGVAPRSGK